MLCQTCINVLEHRTNFVDKSEQDGKPWVVCAHHYNSTTLAESAAKGCYICRPVWSQFSKAEQAALRLEELKHGPDNARNEQNRATVSYSFTHITLQPDMFVNGDYYFSVRFGDEYIDWDRVGSDKENATIMYNLEPVSRAPPRLYELTQSKSTDSEESWSLATDWMSVCLQTHKACNEGGDHGWYPTRLLDVGEAGDAQSSIRLVYSTGASLSGGYCTLSHRWGTHVHFQLNRETVGLLSRGIDIEDLPKTFKDAVVATRRFGVRYLWIDSLCIEQDKTSDWLHEADRMYLVYSNSYCNFSAAASSDSSQGLFRDRQPETLHPNQVSLYANDLGSDVAYASCNVFLASFWDDNVSNCAVNKRGWVLQERMLAPRILYFGPDQLLWECREHSVCESFPGGLPLMIQQNEMTSLKRMDPASLTKQWALIGKKLDPMLANYEIWNLVVRAYSMTSLTVPGDRLVALSGLAKRFMVILDDIYVAGMWRRHLEKSLCWFAISVEPVLDSSTYHPATYRAPTWSWPAADMAIYMETQCDGIMQIKVVDMQLQHATSDTTGVVTGGWLDLMGQLRPMHLYQQSSGLRQSYYISINGCVIKSIEDEESESKGMFIRFDTLPEDYDAFRVDNLANNLYCMICRMPASDWDYVQLLLLRLVDPKKKLYGRLGTAIISIDTECAMEWMDINEETKQLLPCLDYQDGLHTIRII